MAIAAPSPALTKIDHCGRRRLRLLLRRGNMNILVRVAIVFALVAVYCILDSRWRISSKVQGGQIAIGKFLDFRRLALHA